MARLPALHQRRNTQQIESRFPFDYTMLIECTLRLAAALAPLRVSCLNTFCPSVTFRSKLLPPVWLSHPPPLTHTRLSTQKARALMACVVLGVLTKDMPSRTDGGVDGFARYSCHGSGLSPHHTKHDAELLPAYLPSILCSRLGCWRGSA